MSRPKFFTAVETQNHSTTPLRSKEISVDTIKQNIDELEDQIKMIKQQISKLENNKIKMEYFNKRDAVDRGGDIFGQLQYMYSFQTEEERRALDVTLSSQYEIHPEFKNAMKLVASEGKVPLHTKDPDDWSIDTRYKIRSILDQDYSYYKLIQDKYTKKFEEGNKRLETLKSDLRKDVSQLKTLQAALKQQEPVHLVRHNGKAPGK